MLLKIYLSFITSFCISHSVLAAHIVISDISESIDSLWGIYYSPTIETLSPEEMLSICNSYYQIDASLSNAYGEKALNSSFAEENPLFKSKVLLNLGYNLNKQGAITKALQYLREGINIAETNRDLALKMKGLNSLGIYYNDRGDNVLAIQYYTESMKIAGSIGDTLGMIKPHVNLTGIFLEQNRPEKSLEYGLKGLALAKAFKEVRGEGFLSNNIAQAYIAQNNIEKALPYLFRALEISTERDDPESMARNHSNLCKIYSSLNDFSKAKFHCELANELLEPLNNPRSKLLHAINFIQYLLDTNQTETALTHANNALQIGQNADLSIHIGGVYEMLYKIYKKRGDNTKALDMYEKFSDLRHGDLTAKNNAQIASTEVSYKDLIIENERLNSVAQLAQAKNSSIQSKEERNFAILIASILGLAGLFIFKESRQKQKYAKILETKNQEIEKQNDLITTSLSEKETLLKEIHHRVKNNLQIVSSLLNLQSKKEEDIAVLASINEGKNRVEAMSLIHQNLYQNDNFSTINMQNYLIQLLNNLSKSFDLPERNIAFEVDAAAIFDIDTAIPIGLIVNELVTNSSKHAFTDRDSGVINISIREKSANQYELKVQDNGVGMPKNHTPHKSTSLGMKLVHTLGVKQLKGEIDINSKNDGTTITLVFKDQKNIA